MGCECGKSGWKASRCLKEEGVEGGMKAGWMVGERGGEGMSGERQSREGGEEQGDSSRDE